MNKIMIIIGEIFSFLAAICLAYSTFKKQKNKTVFWQIIDSLFNALSNMFLLSYSGMITNIFTFLRNILVLKNKFNKKIMIIFIILALLIGIYFNNRGFIGLLPIFASIEYTLCIYKFESTQKIRISLILNLLLWMIYDFYIKSYPMFIMDIIICLISSINVIRFSNRGDLKNDKKYNI